MDYLYDSVLEMLLCVVTIAYNYNISTPYKEASNNKLNKITAPMIEYAGFFNKLFKLLLLND